jgi:hypothetical protein
MINIVLVNNNNTQIHDVMNDDVMQYIGLTMS